MADPLASARLKLKRANLHAGVARREARRFFNRHPEPAFEIQPHGDQATNVGEVFGCKIVVARGWPDLPESFAPRFGDAIRCVLDHIAWQLVAHGQTPPSAMDERARKLIQFPIYSKSEAFEGQIGIRLPGVSRVVTDYIKARHKYVRGEATNSVLTALADLSNDDKHRTLPVIASAFLNVQGGLRFSNCEFVGYESPPVAPPVKKDAELMYVQARVTKTNPRVTMYFQPAFHIALKDRGGFGDVLRAIQTEVAEVLKAPEIISGVGRSALAA